APATGSARPEMVTRPALALATRAAGSAGPAAAPAGTAGPAGPAGPAAGPRRPLTSELQL
ncbi:MAG TPA: hypothetical protein VMV69_11450, partial [Pirellulales bacterium]|nr:hypothetical protein [Pirellulales bacterium]